MQTYKLLEYYETFLSLRSLCSMALARWREYEEKCRNTQRQVMKEVEHGLYKIQFS
jgi:hypothetical protein